MILVLLSILLSQLFTGTRRKFLGAQN